MDERTLQLGRDNITSLLIKFSLPAIVGMLANSLYTIIDRLFVGNIVGADAIAGMSITMPISFIIMAFGMLIGIGSGALVSIRLGERRPDDAEAILGNAFMLGVIISIITSAIMLTFLDQLLMKFGASSQTLPFGRQFISIILWGSIFQFTSFGLSAVIRSEGNPRMSMVVLLINAGLNILLDFIFIYWLGMGIKGTAVATVISQAVSASLVVYYFTRGNSVLKLRLPCMRLRWQIINEIMAIGMAPFLMQLGASVINILFNRDLAQYGGDSAIAAFGIMNTIIMFILMPIFGINQGAQPIIGFNYGAENYHRVTNALKKAILAATLIASAGFIMGETIPHLLIQAFTPDAEVIAIGTRGMRIFLILLPIVGVQIVSANFFQAIGKAQKSVVLSLLRQVILLIPLLILLPPWLHLDGVWLAGPISDCIATLVTWLVLMQEVKHMRKLRWQSAA
ncbi:MAG: MATE family efflux transporter [Methylocystaceae bacterium]